MGLSRANKAMHLSWTVDGTPTELTPALRVLGKRYPIVEGGKGAALTFEKSGKEGLCEVSLAKGVATISYSSANMALRAVGSLLARLVPEGGSVAEECPFSTFGIMLDCSRNAVMRPEHLKNWLERLALLGYNMAMLYTEDTYELDGEPRFGFLRGAYRTDELRDIDAYAASLGIEMIPCIQTLGHLERILGKPEYREVRDTASVLLVDEPKTYELIERMVSHWASVFKSRRIHVGMDETHDLGRGRFYDRRGDERHFDIFNRHLGRVVAICKAKGLSPMIWSDMYFSMGSKTMNYYDTDGVIPGDVVKSIPREASLVYWDYYHADKAFYLDWIERHRQLGKEPLMGSGVWTWGRLWHDRGLTEANAAPCVQACREAGVKELFFTMWGDDGAYCDFDSALAGLAYVAELGFSGSAGKMTLPARFKAVFGTDYQDAMLPSGIYDVSNSEEPRFDKLPPDLIFWDDPLLLQCIGDNWRKNRSGLDGIASHFASVERSLAGKDRLTEAGDLRLGRLIAAVLAIKASLLPKLLDAYSRQDREAMDKLRKDGLKLLQSKSRACLARFRAMWLRHNKPFGLEFIQGRYAALIERNAELGRKIDAFVSARVESLPEFDANIKG